MRSNLFITFALLIAALFIQQGCSTTDSAIDPNKPHTYLQSYQEVINATEKALRQADMIIIEAHEIDDKNYFIHYYQKSYDMASNNNREAGLGADITITKLSDKRTKLVIKEEKQSGLVPGSHKEYLGRKVLRELNKLLTHEGGSGESDKS